MFVPPSIRTAKGIGSEGAIVFDPELQRVLRVEPVVERLWPLLRAGVSTSEFRERARSTCHDGEQLLQELLSTGIVKPICLKGSHFGVASKVNIRIGNTTILLAFEDESLWQHAEPAFGHLRVAETEHIDDYATLRKTGRGVAISVGGERTKVFSDQEFVPALKIVLTEMAFGRVDLMVLHAASLLDGNRGMLLFGEPGTGKTTLSVHLARSSNLELAGDDVAELLPEGRVLPLPFAAAVKEGASRLLSGTVPSLNSMTSHIRPDGQVVRYIPPKITVQEPLRVNWVIALARREREVARLEPLDVLYTLHMFLQGAWSIDQAVSCVAFDALIHCITNAELYRLVYSDLNEATRLLQGLTSTGENLRGI